MTYRALVSLALSLSVASLISGCGGEEAPSSKVEQAPKPFDPMALELDDPSLIKGREIWVATCGQCHVRGLGGAPIIADKEAWAPRIAKGKGVLYDHAINGFSGPLMNEMPPKGGFTDLTDEEVKLAVDFMVYASN